MLGNLLVWVRARLQDSFHDEATIGFVRKALCGIRYAQLQGLHCHLGDLYGTGIVRDVRDEHLNDLVLHLVAEVHGVEVLADVAEGLQASVAELGVGLGDFGLSAECGDELVPFASGELKAGDGGEDRRYLASHGRMLSLERLQELALDLYFEAVIRQVDPIVLVLCILQ